MKYWLTIIVTAGALAVLSGCQDKCTAANNTVSDKIESCGAPRPTSDPFSGCNEDSADSVECVANCVNEQSCTDLMANTSGVIGLCTSMCSF